MKKLIVPLLVLCFGVYCALLAFPWMMKINAPPDNHFVLLANQFLHFKVGLEPISLPRGDVAEFFDKRYLYFGPFPSILLVPFVAVLGKEFPQFIIGPICLFASFLLTFFITKKLKFNSADSLWVSIFIAFSTALFPIGLMPVSAGQVQAIGMVLMLLMVAEYFSKKRPLVLGIFIALAGMTRFPLYLSVVFFILVFLFNRFTFRQLIILLIPIVLSLLLLGAYNYKRFRSPFESGYKYNMTHSNYPLDANIRYGLISVKYLPSNLYSLFLKSPDPILEDGGGFLLKFPYLKMDPWGLAIWYTSPLLLYLIFKFKRNRESVAALVAAGAISIPSLIFFSIGYAQIGYRYALDFLPFLLMMLFFSSAPKLSFTQKMLIIIGVLFNCLYLTSIWGVYPLFGIQ